MNLALLVLFIYFCGSGVLTQGFHLEPFHQPYFCEGFFEIRSLKLFAWASFEL
jgi:hypothetical protein